MNHQAVYNGFASMFRNMLVSMTASITLIGFSEKFDLMAPAVRLIGFIVMMTSAFIGFKTYRDFLDYIDSIESEVPMAKRWRSWAYTSLFYSALIFTLAAIYLFRKLLVF
jgi:hypothetical protein